MERLHSSGVGGMGGGLLAGTFCWCADCGDNVVGPLDATGGSVMNICASIEKKSAILDFCIEIHISQKSTLLMSLIGMPTHIPVAAPIRKVRMINHSFNTDMLAWSYSHLRCGCDIY